MLFNIFQNFQNQQSELLCDNLTISKSHIVLLPLLTTKMSKKNLDTVLESFVPQSKYTNWTQRKICPNSEFFWSVFSHIWTEYWHLLCKSLRIQSKCGEIRTRKTLNTDTYYTMRESRENFTAATEFKMSWKKLQLKY